VISVIKPQTFNQSVLFATMPGLATTRRSITSSVRDLDILQARQILRRYIPQQHLHSRSKVDLRFEVLVVRVHIHAMNWFYLQFTAACGTVK
jgi:hypothetical protein